MEAEDEVLMLVTGLHGSKFIECLDLNLSESHPPSQPCSSSSFPPVSYPSPQSISLPSTVMNKFVRRLSRRQSSNPTTPTPTTTTSISSSPVPSLKSNTTTPHKLKTLIDLKRSSINLSSHTPSPPQHHHQHHLNPNSLSPSSRVSLLPILNLRRRSNPKTPSPSRSVIFFQNLTFSTQLNFISSSQSSSTNSRSSLRNQQRF